MEDENPEGSSPGAIFFNTLLTLAMVAVTAYFVWVATSQGWRGALIALPGTIFLGWFAGGVRGLPTIISLMLMTDMILVGFGTVQGAAWYGVLGALLGGCAAYVLACFLVNGPVLILSTSRTTASAVYRTTAPFPGLRRWREKPPPSAIRTISG